MCLGGYSQRSWNCFDLCLLGVTPDFLETALKTDSERSRTEILRQDAVSKHLYFLSFNES